MQHICSFASAIKNVPPFTPASGETVFCLYLFFRQKPIRKRVSRRLGLLSFQEDLLRPFSDFGLELFQYP
jgi:hypothetical protein